MTCKLVMALGLAIGMLAGPASAADDARLKAYGEHLSGECFTCHRKDGTDVGIPPIVGLPPSEFIQAMNLYRTGLRPNDVMISIATSLDENQWQALAVYLATLGKGAGKAKAK